MNDVGAGAGGAASSGDIGAGAVEVLGGGAVETFSPAVGDIDLLVLVETPRYVRKRWTARTARRTLPAVHIPLVAGDNPISAVDRARCGIMLFCTESDGGDRLLTAIRASTRRQSIVVT